MGHQGSLVWQVLPDRFGSPYPAECRRCHIYVTDGSVNLWKTVTSTECCAEIWNRRYCVSLLADCVVAVAVADVADAVADGTTVAAYCGGVVAAAYCGGVVVLMVVDGVVAPA